MVSSQLSESEVEFGFQVDQEIEITKDDELILQLMK